MGSLLWFIVVVLVIFWALGYFVANLGSLLHLLLVIAIIVVIWNLVSGRRTP